jgi:hypothetical protein
MWTHILKRWRWAVGGLVLGLAISWWRGYVGLDRSLLERDTLDVTEFEQLLVAKSPSGQPLLRDIRFFGHEGGTDWVIAEQLSGGTRGPEKAVSYIPVKIGAQRPYVPKLNAPPKPDANYTVFDYLKSIQASNPQVRFSSRWWDREPARSVVYALIAVIALAGAGPFVVGVLSGGATVSTAGSKADAEYLARFGKGGGDVPARPGKHHPSEAELARLRELEAELERRLAGDGTAETPAAPASGADPPPSAPQVKKLDAGPLEAPAEQKPKQAKEYGGEFYPTETHVKRH